KHLGTVEQAVEGALLLAAVQRQIRRDGRWRGRGLRRVGQTLLALMFAALPVRRSRRMIGAGNSGGDRGAPPAALFLDLFPEVFGRGRGGRARLLPESVERRAQHFVISLPGQRGSHFVTELM